ncbi:uncharacterized protein LOC142320110 isoform X1 [Lycorma delicatula]|uniref:uncharacterized protein LOC142320110 isoform X1 n=1 Tax=Lycorma delicatula TaxID=130591 RepID=UPI003F510184
MAASWFSLIVLCVTLLRVAENLPVEGDVVSSLDSVLSEEIGSIDSGSSDSNQQEAGGGSLNRDKRTIGFLRQLFPGLSQIVDRKIQMLTRIIFRVIGRLVLRGGAGGGGGGTASSDGGSRKISITLPTFPPSEDDESEDEDETESDDDASNSTTESATEAADSDSTTTTEASDAENSVAETKISETKIRVARDTTNNDDDQAADATGDNDTDSDVDSASDDNEGEGSEENPRNKRLLNFNLGGGGGSSGGGSGNFLFDIIRLVAGSGTTQEKDEAENAPVEDGSGGASASGSVDLGTGKDDGYSAGVPGPLTRLFVIANRGIANLMQDLILRLAQTSERIVNFKARLITSII